MGILATPIQALVILPGVALGIVDQGAGAPFALLLLENFFICGIEGHCLFGFPCLLLCKLVILALGLIHQLLRIVKATCIVLQLEEHNMGTKRLICCQVISIKEVDDEV